VFLLIETENKLLVDAVWLVAVCFPIHSSGKSTSRHGFVANPMGMRCLYGKIRERKIRRFVDCDERIED
jgi:hypothetical protein